MSYDLSKNEKYALDGALTKCYVGLGWIGADLDLMALMLNSDGLMIPPPHGLVYYGNPTYPSLPSKEWEDSSSPTTRNEPRIKAQPIWLSPDVKEVEGDAGGDVEFMGIDFAKIPTEVNQILIAVTIFQEDIEAGVTFATTGKLYLRIAHSANGVEIARFALNDLFKTEVSALMGRFYRDNTNKWHFEAIGKASSKNTQALIDHFSKK